jgi:predicted DNA-binding transcriptional regulator YafY
MTEDRETIIRYRVIDNCLRGNRQADSAQLAAACSEALDGKEISPALIEDDLSRMSESSDPGFYAPVKRDPLTDKYYYEDPEYSIANYSPNPEDVDTTLSLSELLDQIRNRGLFTELGGIIQKLAEASRISEIKTDKSLTDIIEFEKMPASSGNEFLIQIILSIVHQKVLKIFYKPFEEEKPYFTYVHPYLLKEYRYRWYLVGLNEQRNTLRTYALDRIWELEESDHVFRSSDLTARDYFRYSAGVIVPSGKPADIVVEVRKPQAYYLISQPIHETQLIREETDEYIVFTFHVFPTWEFMSMIRALGSEARILRPVELREQMIRDLGETLGNYNLPAGEE